MIVDWFFLFITTSSTPYNAQIAKQQATSLFFSTLLDAISCITKRPSELSLNVTISFTTFLTLFIIFQYDRIIVLCCQFLLIRSFMLLILLAITWLFSFIGYHYWREKVWVIVDNRYITYYRLFKYINIAITLILFFLEYLT